MILKREERDCEFREERKKERFFSCPLLRGEETSTYTLITPSHAVTVPASPRFVPGCEQKAENIENRKKRRRISQMRAFGKG